MGKNFKITYDLVRTEIFDIDITKLAELVVNSDSDETDSDVLYDYFCINSISFLRDLGLPEDAIISENISWWMVDGIKNDLIEAIKEVLNNKINK